MSELSDLVYGAGNAPWPYFTEKFPVKIKQITSLDNDQLIKDIRESGDYLQGRTGAKCLMNRWDMHTVYESFREVSKVAREITSKCPMATKTDTKGNPLDVPLYLNDSWGLIYTKGSETKLHNHWPSLWSYTYCLNGCDNCAPLMFPTAVAPDGKPLPEMMRVLPKTSQMVLFPSWLLHYVPVHTCDHERIMVVGNLNVEKNWENRERDVYGVSGSWDQHG